MLLSSLLGLAFAACSCAVPLKDYEHTEVSIGNSKAALDAGQISIQLSRVDDLVDETHHALLLERITHIGLEISLNKKRGCMMINKQEYPLDGPVDAQVAVVKAESYKLGENLPSALYEPQNVEAMSESLSKGIVSLEVKITSEEIPVAVGLEQGDDLVAVIQDDHVTMRRLGLFIKIKEIEGMSFEHDTMVFAPILQLLLKSNNGRIAEINTLSIAGRPVTQDSGLNSIDEARVPAPFRPKHHATALEKWLGSMFGQVRQEARIPNMRAGLAAADTDRFRKGRPLAPQHGRHHHRHGGCFGRRFKHGLSFVGQSLGHFFLETLVGSIFLGLIGGLACFVVGKYIGIFLAFLVHKMFGRAQPESTEDEKIYLVIEDGEVPPTYEDVRVGSPLFDADQEMRDEKH